MDASMNDNTCCALNLYLFVQPEDGLFVKQNHVAVG
jgi:hypothetical protein